MLWVLMLMGLNFPIPVDSKTLAGAGYFASSPVVRNFLLAKGLGRKFRNQADILYDLSGFRSVGDQGSGRRQANTFFHNVVEVDADELARRYGMILPPGSHIRVKRDHPSHSDRQYMENLFAVVQRMDKKLCISRVVCEIGADPKKFGANGERIHNYLRKMPPVPWNSATYPYVEAHIIGTSGGLKACFEEYGSCSYNLEKLSKRLEILGVPLKVSPT